MTWRLYLMQKAICFTLQEEKVEVKHLTPNCDDGSLW